MSDPTAVRRPVWSLTMHEENLGLEYVTQVEHLQLEFDEARAPRVICRADVVLPTIATRAWIDPRAQVRGYVAAGYGEGGDPGSFLLANLGLRGRRIRHGDGVLELDHAGDEALMIDGAVSASSLSAASTLAAIEALVTQTITAATFTTSLAGGSGPAVAIDKVTDRWATAADLTDQLGNVDVYDDGYRHWHIADRPTTVGTITATYKTGPGGTISRLDEVDNREEWYNYARLGLPLDRLRRDRSRGGRREEHHLGPFRSRRRRQPAHVPRGPRARGDLDDGRDRGRVGPSAPDVPRPHAHLPGPCRPPPPAGALDPGRARRPGVGAPRFACHPRLVRVDGGHDPIP